jgi:hypothetical protein
VEFLATRNTEEFVTWEDAMATIAINTMNHETWGRHRQEGDSQQHQEQGQQRDALMKKKTQDYDNHSCKLVLLSWQTLRRQGNHNDQAFTSLRQLLLQKRPLSVSSFPLHWRSIHL